MFRFAPLVSLALVSVAVAQTYTATYTPENAPDKTQTGQAGTSKCGTKSDPKSQCQTLHINSVQDFCIFGPPEPGPKSDIGTTERIEVAYCTQDGHGTRLIPPGTITGAHFLQTPDYVQVTGVGDFTKINVPKGDTGGELDPHGADGNGNPIGGLVFSNAYGKTEQMHEWTNFMSADQFCVRACRDNGEKAESLCQHIYDVMGCFWNMPGNYLAGSFDSCKGESGEPMGVYGGQTFHQGDAVTPPAHPAPPSSSCTPVKTIGIASTTTSSSTVPTSTSVARLAGPTVTHPPATTPTGTRVSKNSAAPLLGHGLEFMAIGFAIVLGAGFMA